MSTNPRFWELTTFDTPDTTSLKPNTEVAPPSSALPGLVSHVLMCSSGLLSQTPPDSADVSTLSPLLNCQ